MICYVLNKKDIQFQGCKLSCEYRLSKFLVSSYVSVSVRVVCVGRLASLCFLYTNQLDTGNLNIIHDKRKRTLISKGPKYRYPSRIDFHQCKETILESLDDYIRKWCKREHAVIDAFCAWKNQIIKIMDQRITFYQLNPEAKLYNDQVFFT